MRRRPRPLLCTLMLGALLAVPILAVPPAAADRIPPTPSPTPEPQQLTNRQDGFDLSSVVGLVRGQQTDADAERVVRQTLEQAGVKSVRTTDGKDPGTEVTVWIGSGGSALAELRVPPADGLPAEGYVLAAGRGPAGRKHVVLDGVDTDGIYYAARTLAQLVRRSSVPGVEIRDWPTMRYRGSIEGFYGTPWSHADRLDHLDYLGAHKMNTYEYAPKDDPYHREKWREPYPADKLAQLGELVTRARQNKVDFTFALSPGLDLCFTSDADFQALVAKFQALYDLGARAFNVPFDDIDYAAWHCEADRARYGTGGAAAGRAQSDVLNRVKREWVESKPDVAPLQMVPTEYYNTTETPYKKALREQLDADVVVHWTGTAVIPRTITAAQAARAKAVFGHDILIWDNYPVNDYIAGRLPLGDYSGREPGIADHVAGVISNPTNQAAVSKVALYSFAELGWKTASYDARESWLRALAERAGGDRHTFEALKIFGDLNTFDTTLHPAAAPELARRIDGFWQAWNAGDRGRAVAALRRPVGDIERAPARIRAGVVDPAFTAEAASWLQATELWGAALRRSLDLLEAVAEGNGSAAWAARQEVASLVGRATAIRDVRIPHDRTHPRIGDRVVDAFVAEAGRLHDRWLGVDPGVTATTTLGTHEDNVPQRMIDGDPGTFYWSNGAPGPGDAVGVDLGGVREIGEIAVLMGKPTSPDDYIHTGALEFSADGNQWTELTRGTTPEVRATAPAATKARYVRYRTLAGNSGNWLVVREFTVQVTGGTQTTLTISGRPEPADGSSLGRAIDGNLETAYVASSRPAEGDALTATLSAPRKLAGLSVLQRSGSVGIASLEIHTGGAWKSVGTAQAAYTEVGTGEALVDAVRFVWATGTTAPQVAEIVPRWADLPAVELGVPPEAVDAAAGRATSVTVQVTAGPAADVNGTLTVLAPPGWQAEPDTSRIRAPRGLGQSVQVGLTPPADSPIGTVDVPVRFTTGGETLTATIRVAVRPDVSETNAALRRPATASGVEPGTSFRPDLAVDGDTATRWASGYDDASWLQVDLGSRTSLGKVVLRWEAAYGSAYRIEVSDDGSTWTTAAEVAGGDGGTDTVWLDASGRYVRMQGGTRASRWGYSLYELEVYPRH